MREQRKVVTVLFCDLVGSTALGESTDPEALRARMQRYFADLRTIVERHGGSVERIAHRCHPSRRARRNRVRLQDAHGSLCGGHRGAPRWRTARARVLSARGEHDEALALLGEAVALVEQIDFLELKGYVHDVCAEALARVDRIDEAVSAVERAIVFHEQKGNVVSAARSQSALEGLRATRRS